MRRRLKRDTQEELNVTSFLNLMIILVPVLLTNMMFTQLSVLGLQLPDDDNKAAKDNELSVSLQVRLYDDRMEVVELVGGVSNTLDIIQADDPKSFELLNTSLHSIKQKKHHAERSDISVYSNNLTRYQTVISVMDSARSYPLVGNGADTSLLFPNVALGRLEDVIPASSLAGSL